MTVIIAVAAFCSLYVGWIIYVIAYHRGWSKGFTQCSSIHGGAAGRASEK